MTIITAARKRIIDLGKRTIDLGGPEGNAFAMIGVASNFARQLGYSKEEIEDFRADMMSGDYEHLIQVFDSKLGSFVDLIRPEKNAFEDDE